jgi:pimeloyl-ACP methyl ester carboxylesterase
VPTAAVNGTELHYEHLGESGPPVLLVMGVRARGMAWMPVAERLAADHRVVFWDHRGVGGSHPLSGPTSIAEMAADGIGLMDHLGWDTAHVAGVSMGGSISQHLALTWPERVRSLTLIATTAHGKGLQQTDLPTILRYFSTFFGSRDVRLAKLARFIYSAEHIEREGMDAVIDRMKLAFGHEHKGTARAQVQAMRAFDVREELHRISAPTLVMGAGGDRIVPERHQKLIHERVPGAEYVGFPRAAHGVVVEEAEDISVRVSRLISRVEARVEQRRADEAG